MNIAFLITLLASSVAIKGYDVPIKHILEGKPQRSLQSFYQQIQKESSKEKIKEILSFLDHHFMAFHSKKEFMAKVVPYNNKDCHQNTVPKALCSSYSGLDFFLSKTLDGQVLIIGNDEYQYEVQRRVPLQQTTVSFGEALHLIHSSSWVGLYTILLREIEYGVDKKKIKQTINLFKVKKGNQSQTCKIAEFDISHNEENYKLVTIYAKLLAPYHRCQHKQVLF